MSLPGQQAGRDARGVAVASHHCRVLVCFHQYPDLSIHPVALVPAVLHLVQFLWRVSRLNLRLIPTHPDRAAGLGFLGQSTYAFGPILFAQGTLLAGLIASRIFYEGQKLVAFKMEAAGFLAFFIAAILSPLLVFTPHLVSARRRGLDEYGSLASRYVQEFDEKWLQGGASSEEELMGSCDIQSLADLGNSFAVVQEMRPVPFALKDVARLAVATAAPLLPLGLTVLSFEELMTSLIKILL
jgi:hypothetical protein